MTLTLRPSENLPGYFTLERESHDGRQWTEIRTDDDGPYEWLCSSARVNPRGAPVEGYSDEFKAIAEAILRGSGVSFKRCAVRPCEGGFVFWSPHHDQDTSVLEPVTADDARAWAVDAFGQR